MMQFKNIIYVLFLTLLFLFCKGAFGHTLVVCNTCAIHSIKSAIHLASAGDTVLIKAGKYNTYNIVIDKPLTIMGQGMPIIDGEDQGEIIRVVSDNVTIDGLSLIRVGTSYIHDYAAIRVVKSRDFLIQNVHLEKYFSGFI